MKQYCCHYKYHVYQRLIIKSFIKFLIQISVKVVKKNNNKKLKHYKPQELLHHPPRRKLMEYFGILYFQRQHNFKKALKIHIQKIIFKISHI